MTTPEKTAAILEEECKRFRSQYEGGHQHPAASPAAAAAYPAMWAAATKWGAAVTNNPSSSVPAIKQEKQSVPHLLAEMVEQQQQQHQHQQHPQQHPQHPQSPGGGGSDSPYPAATFFNGVPGVPNSGGGSSGAEALYESMSQAYPALTSSLGEFLQA